MKTIFSKKEEKKGGDRWSQNLRGKKGLPFSAAHLRNHLSTK